MGRRRLGVQDCNGAVLASVDLAVAHAGLSGLRPERGRVSHHEPAAAHNQCAPALHRLEGDDRRDLAERVRRSRFRLAPGARRVGGMGCQPQGCSQHLVLPPHVVGLPPLRGSPRGQTRSPKLEGRGKSEGRGPNPRRGSKHRVSGIHHPASSIRALLHSLPHLLCPRPHIQTNCGHATRSLIAPGLLAAPPVRTRVFRDFPKGGARALLPATSF